MIGTLIPGAILVVMGLVYLLQGNHSAAPMDADHLVPAWTGLAGLVLVVNNFLSYAGMEMNAVHVSELKDPAASSRRRYSSPWASCWPSSSCRRSRSRWVIPAQELSLTAGVMQAFSAFFAHFGMSFLVPLIALALVAASLSGMNAWLAGPSKGLLKIGAEQGYLPPYFQKLNAEGIQVNILVAQGVVTTSSGCSTPSCRASPAPTGSSR